MSEHTAPQLLSAFVSAIKDTIIPLTAKGVAEGAKVFGAAILRKDDLSVVLGATNNEVDSPLLVRLTHDEGCASSKANMSVAWRDQLYPAVLCYTC
jgi:tRNA(Arg) A34 adenosine deaminase TadA